MKIRDRPPALGGGRRNDLTIMELIKQKNGLSRDTLGVLGVNGL
ncbi:MAG: hypothetical protein ABSB19_19985 [Methylomonas sp.]